MYAEVLPLAGAHALELVVVEEVERLVRRLLLPAAQQAPHVFSVDDAVSGKAEPRQVQEGGEEVDAHGGLARTRLPPATFPGQRAIRGTRYPPSKLWPLRPLQRAGAAVVPRAVVAGEEHQGVFLQAVALEAVQHLAHAPVELLDRVPVAAALGAVLEAFRRDAGLVRVLVAEVKEKGLLPRALDEGDRLLREEARVLCLVQADVIRYFLVIAPEGDREVVVGPVESQEMVEAVPVREVIAVTW